MRITNCKTNHLASPLGYRIEKPVFSWIVEQAEGAYQAARIRISATPDLTEDLLLDTGFTNAIDSLSYEANLVLAPRTRYYWDVTVQSDAGEEAASGTNWFETAKQDEPWAGEWLTCDNTEERHPVFFKNIELAGKVETARLYICGLGLYEAYLNGEKISDELMTPHCNAYDKWLQYQTYDVTSQLGDSGELAVLLGNGWYKGRFGFNSQMNNKPYYGDEWLLIAELHVHYRDGSESIFATDETWQVRRSNITGSSIYDGESVDMTLAPSEIETAVVFAGNTAPLIARESTSVTAREQLPVLEILQTPAGETVLDIGQNLAGSFRLRVHEPVGATIKLQFGEVLQNGNFYRDNLRTAKAEYTFVSDGNEHILQPHFTFYGYRYVKLEGFSALKLEDFTALALYSEIPRTGRIVTGNQLVNQLIANTEWGMKSNFLDVPTDCPQRDERMGWTGDAAVFTPTACYLRDSYAFLRKYLVDLEQEQQKYNGQVPRFIPAFGNEGTSSVWGDAACTIPWSLYTFYGDTGILHQCYGSMKAWVDYVAKVDGDNHGWREAFHFGDWLALDNFTGDPNESQGATDKGFIADVYYMHSARLLAKAAAVLRNHEEADKYNALADKVLAGIREEYFSHTGRCCINTQTALVLALHFGLIDEDNRSAKALRAKFEQTGGKLQTGFVGTPLLCPTLASNGQQEIAYNLLLNEEYPGWLYQVKLGATTIWERWNSLQPDGSISSTGMNSLNHYAYGSIVAWLYSHAAGLTPCETQPGFRVANIAPIPDARLAFLDMEYASAAGVWRVAWKVRGTDDFRLEVEVPFGCTGRLTLPYAPPEVYQGAANPIFENMEEDICILEPGCYMVSYTTTVPLKKVFSTSMPLVELLANPRVKAFLERAMPQITQMPSHFKQSSLREIAASYGGGADSSQFDQLDKALEAL